MRTYLQRGLRCKSRSLSAKIPKLPLHPPLTFLMPSGFRCKATSFSGLTTGMVDIMLHVICQMREEEYVARLTETVRRRTYFYVTWRLFLRMIQNDAHGKVPPLATPPWQLVTCMNTNRKGVETHRNTNNRILLCLFWDIHQI